ncbi:ABC transporter permease [Mycobacterium sp. NPDC048908]|uniref:ABC transporter permease n=1 Tax=Mycobacterium sp. NPDC048908 TaxID=3364292 RepID=UPI00371D062F
MADRLRDAITPRTLLLGVGVLVLQFAFILSYLGAFHSPQPHRIPVTVVAPPQVADQLVDQLNAVSGEPVHATASNHEIEARQALRRGETSAVYVVSRAGTRDSLLVASGGGTSVATAAEQLFTLAAQQHGRTVAVQDLVPLSRGDVRGLSGFYLVIGWAVGGCLFAAMLGVAKGSRPAALPRARWRLGATLPYALVSGLGGATIAGPMLGALDGHFWPVAVIGVLVTLSAATVTIALQTLFGVIGIALTAVIFVILGNPSAGGAYQAPLLPPLWRAISSYLPNGAGTDAIRRIVYFDAHGLTHPIVVLAVWIIGGATLTLVGSAVVKHPRQ